MIITFNTDNIEREGLTTSEFLLLLSTKLGYSIHGKDARSLSEKGYIRYDDIDIDMYPSKLDITLEGDAAVEGVLSGSMINEDSNNRLENLAQKLIDIFPKGRKEGTNYMWRDSKINITRRLKVLQEKYKIDFTDDQAIKATKAYVDSFNGNYKTMRLLKYFLYKLETKDGAVEFNSEFASLLDNEGEMEIAREDWTNSLI